MSELETTGITSSQSERAENLRRLLGGGDISELVAAHIAVGNSGILLSQDHPEFMRPPAGVRIVAPSEATLLGDTAVAQSGSDPAHFHQVYGDSSDNTFDNISGQAVGSIIPKTGGGILPHTWKRFRQSMNGEATISGSWVQALTIFQGEGDGITQIQNLNIRMVAAASSVTGFIALRVCRWNSELLNAISNSVMGNIENDYRINIRERTVPVLNNASVYETKIKALRLRSDEDLAVFVRRDGTSIGSKYTIQATGSFREADKGDF